MDLKECLLFGFFCVVILAPFSLAEPFEVSSPPSVMGNVGQDAVLPCQISLKTQPHKMEVKWERIVDKHGDNIYHFATVTGQETFGPGYLGKIGLLKEGLGTGNVSLKLKTVQVNDEGTYRCIVKSSDWISQTQTVLQVAAFGNVSIEVLGPEGEGIRLACKSSGWFPEPELQWLTKDPQNPQLESNQDHEQLFSVSSSITVLRDSGEITCSVHPRRDLSKKWESTILLSRDIFPHTSPWFLAFWIIIIPIVLAVVVLAFFVYKGKQKESKRKLDEEEQRTLLENETETLKSENKGLKKNLETTQEELGKLEESQRKYEKQENELEVKLKEAERKCEQQEIKLKENQQRIEQLEKQQQIEQLERQNSCQFSSKLSSSSSRPTNQAATLNKKPMR